jgi:hypothetical protein
MDTFVINLNNQGLFVSLASLSQNANTASKIDMVIPTTQYQALPPALRIPGAGKDYVLQVAPDFDDSLEFSHVNV